MDLLLLPSLSNCCFPRLLPSNINTSQLVTSGSSVRVPRPFQCKAAISQIASNDAIVARRSANYQPCIWHHHYIESLTSEYVPESSFSRRIDKLKGDVRMMFLHVVDPLEQLELIDNLQRLGLGYHFENEISRVLEAIYNTNRSGDKCKQENLYAVALEFRLLRQHGYSMPHEIFNSFKDETGQFKASLGDDIEGLLCLYEASFLLIEGESVLEDARNFATKELKGYINERNKDLNLSTMVRHALELPLLWRMRRFEGRWFIDEYRRNKDMNPILLELAELDFNMVQAAHQEELKQMSRWWRSTCLGEKLSFARDRLMENFMWAVGMCSEPQFSYFRTTVTKVNLLLTVIDDIYDVYGTLDELELFTDAIERWDTNVDGLPYYMQICFLAVYNFVNETAFDVLKERGIHIIRQLKKGWADQCRAYLQEAKWYYSGYTPTLQEYMENAWVSVAIPVMLRHTYFSVTNQIAPEALDFWEEHYPNILILSSTIVRLADDLGTSTDELERGDVPKSIQCYMKETGATEEEAREYIRSLIGETWKKMNEEGTACSLSSPKFVEIAMNVVKTAQFMYLHGDGHAKQDRESKERVLSLFVHPIPSHK